MPSTPWCNACERSHANAPCGPHPKPYNVAYAVAEEMRMKQAQPLRRTRGPRVPEVGQ